MTSELLYDREFIIFFFYMLLKSNRFLKQSFTLVKNCFENKFVILSILGRLICQTDSYYNAMESNYLILIYTKNIHTPGAQGKHINSLKYKFKTKKTNEFKINKYIKKIIFLVPN